VAAVSGSPQSVPDGLDPAPYAVPPPPANSDRAVVMSVDSGIVVPSFMGKSLRAAVEYAQQSGVEISVLGSGIARQQSPLPGTHLPAGQRVTVRFSH